ncbi:MAG TPA: SIMPL domain-containing protein [Chthoniobacterales bacterium]|nr:SIMPL domain-containing protein [Chthoniobacterales bacterium]
MKRPFIFTIAGLFSILAIARAQVAAAPTPGQTPQIISVYGTGTVHVAPNLATITIAVITQNKDALQAQQENAKRSVEVTNAVKGVSDPTLEVSTGDYAITVQHPIEGNVRTTEITGYQVTNTISVKLHDLSKVGEVLDQATLAGANSVSQVSFDLENNEASRREALSAATADAVARVQAIARGLNANDGSPVRFRTIDVSEPGLEYTPGRANDQVIRSFAPAAASTPIEVGRLDVTATVCLRAELL